MIAITTSNSISVKTKQVRGPAVSWHNPLIARFLQEILTNVPSNRDRRKLTVDLRPCKVRRLRMRSPWNPCSMTSVLGPQFSQRTERSTPSDSRSGRNTTSRADRPACLNRGVRRPSNQSCMVLTNPLAPGAIHPGTGMYCPRKCYIGGFRCTLSVAGILRLYSQINGKVKGDATTRNTCQCYAYDQVQLEGRCAHAGR